MKITLKMLSGRPKDIYLDSSSISVGAIKQTISDVLNIPVVQLEIHNIINKDGQSLGAIYNDDPNDESLLNIFKKNLNTNSLYIGLNEHLTMYICYRLGAGFYRPTEANPRGYNPNLYNEHPEIFNGDPRKASGIQGRESVDIKTLLDSKTHELTKNSDPSDLTPHQRMMLFSSQRDVSLRNNSLTQKVILQQDNSTQVKAESLPNYIKPPYRYIAMVMIQDYSNITAATNEIQTMVKSNDKKNIDYTIKLLITAVRNRELSQETAKILKNNLVYLEDHLKEYYSANSPLRVWINDIKNVNGIKAEVRSLIPRYP